MVRPAVGCADVTIPTGPVPPHHRTDPAAGTAPTDGAASSGDHPPSDHPTSRTGSVDLAARRLGGLVVATNDEFFGAADHLLDPRPAVFDPQAFGDRGKVMDGWETRRRRSPGHDWCIVRLGVGGVVDEVVVDTSHFRGNHPQSVALEGTVCDDTVPAADADWFPLVDRTDVHGHDLATLAVATPTRVTHVRLTIHPDGGVARLRVRGRPVVDLHALADPGGRLDLAALVNGGSIADRSDQFFADATNLLMVGDARDMGDGWETRRRRDDGHDWVVVALATTGTVERIELDTTHYRGNFPDTCRVDATHAPDADAAALADATWTTIAQDRMRPHARHVLAATESVAATHLRLVLEPDGGVARMRAFGVVTDDGWRRAGVTMLDALPDDDVRTVLQACCGSRTWVDAMVARRPFGDVATLLEAADATWASLDDDDHLEAFAAHPRIGERSSSALSTREQAGAADAGDDVKSRLHAGNVAYEERFGHVFLIRAAGRSADEMLAALKERLDHDAASELAVAAEQQRQITRLRLDGWLRHGQHG